MYSRDHFSRQNCFQNCFHLRYPHFIIMGCLRPQSPCFHWLRWMPHRHHEISLAENTPCHHCLGLDNIHLRAVEEYNLYKISSHNIGSSCLQGGSLYMTKRSSVLIDLFSRKSLLIEKVSRKKHPV